MKRFLVLSLVVASATAVAAVDVEVKVGDEGWSIFFDAPRLSKKHALTKPDEEEFTYSASAGRLDISLFVQKAGEAGNRNKDAFMHFWSKVSENPTVVKETVIVSEIMKYIRVEYEMAVNVLGKSVRQKNVNYFFAYRDRWANVHISVLRPTASDEQIFRVFDESLSYGG